MKIPAVTHPFCTSFIPPTWPREIMLKSSMSLHQFT